MIFAGARSDLPTIYPAADAFVLPTLYETFALVCLEAMASGLPVLASPVGGIEDYLHDDVNGLHVQRDATEIAAKLDRLLNDRELHARLREAGIATAQNYEWKNIAQQYLTLFDELIAERTRLGEPGRPAFMGWGITRAQPIAGSADVRSAQRTKVAYVF